MNSLSLDEIDMLGRIYLTSESKLNELEWGYFKKHEEDSTKIYLITPKQLEKANYIADLYGEVRYSEIDDYGETLGVTPCIKVMGIDSEIVRIEIEFFPYGRENLYQFSSFYGTSDFISLMSHFLIEFLRYSINYLRNQGWKRLDIVFSAYNNDKAALEEFVRRIEKVEYYIANGEEISIFNLSFPLC